MQFLTPQQAYPDSEQVSVTVHRRVSIALDHSRVVQLHPGPQHVPHEIAHHSHFHRHGVIHHMKVEEPVNAGKEFTIDAMPHVIQAITETITTPDSAETTTETPAAAEIVNAPEVQQPVTNAAPVAPKPTTPAPQIRRPAPVVRKR